MKLTQKAGGGAKTPLPAVAVKLIINNFLTIID